MLGDAKSCRASQGWAKLTRLRTLYVIECCEIEELLGVEYLISLETLSVIRCDKLHSIPGLKAVVEAQNTKC